MLLVVIVFPSSPGLSSFPQFIRTKRDRKVKKKKLIMRLTQDHIARAPQITNPLGDRELDLRGNGLMNLGGDEGALALLQDSFDTIDLTDNFLSKIEKFPKMERLTTLICHRNRLEKVSHDVTISLPNLKNFIADDNEFESLDSLIVFRSFRKLERISMSYTLQWKGRNKVSIDDRFRLFLIFLCPTLKLINFQRVLEQERVEARRRTAEFEELVKNAKGAAAMVAGVEIEGKRNRKRARQVARDDKVSTSSSVASILNGVAEADMDQFLRNKMDELEEKLMAAYNDGEDGNEYLEQIAALEQIINKRR